LLLGLSAPAAELLEAGVAGIHPLHQRPQGVRGPLLRRPHLAALLLNHLCKLLQVALEPHADPLCRLLHFGGGLLACLAEAYVEAAEVLSAELL